MSTFVQLDQLPTLTNQPSVESLLKNKYIRLITYKKDKTPVSTPVWFVFDNSIQDSHTIFITTAKRAGKLKRLSHTGYVAFAFCCASGKIRSEFFKGSAKRLGEEEILYAHNLLDKKYGLIFKIWGTFYLRKNNRAYIKLTF